MTQKFDVNVELTGGKVIMDGLREVMEKGAGNGPPKAPGASTEEQKGDPSLKKEAEDTNKNLEGLTGFMSRLGKTLGIQVGLSSILKQSQIFTGTIGSIFQIFGALVDVILAPFLPIIVPAIRFLAGLIPVIHKTISAIFNWIKEKMPSKEAFNSTVTDWGNKVIDSLFFLPEDMREKMKAWWAGTDHAAWMKKAAIGTVLALAFGKMGIFKFLTGILTKIPIVGPMFSRLIGVFSTAFTKVLGAINPFKALKMIPGKGLATSGGSHIAGKIGGLLGGLKGLAGKGAAKLGMGGRVGGMVTGALGKVGGKGALAKLIPGVGGLITAAAGLKAGYDTFKGAEGSFMSRLGKGALVGGVGVAGGALSMAPGMGLVAPIVTGIATQMMKDKFTQPVQINQTIVTPEGTELTKRIIEGEAEHREFTDYNQMRNAGIDK